MDHCRRPLVVCNLVRRASPRDLRSGPAAGYGSESKACHPRSDPIPSRLRHTSICIMYMCSAHAWTACSGSQAPSLTGTTPAEPVASPHHAFFHLGGKTQAVVSASVRERHSVESLRQALPPPSLGGTYSTVRRASSLPHHGSVLLAGRSSSDYDRFEARAVASGSDFPCVPYNID